MSFWNSYFLITPYFALIVYFLIYQTDNFFLKTRSSVQLLFVLMFLVGVFLNFLLWKTFFNTYDFLGYNIREISGKNKILPLITIMATIIAVCGWIFTSRVQIINAVKGHSMQVLMNSRTSTIYMQKVDTTIVIRRELIKNNTQNDSEAENKVTLSVEKFKELTDEEKSAIIYMLNFLEFVALGIRHYNLDEQLLKASLRSILNSNYQLYYKVIAYLRKEDNSTIYTQVELLHRRWNINNQITCSSCNNWYISNKEDKTFIEQYKFHILNIVMTVITCFIWLLIVLGMWILKKYTSGGNNDLSVCTKCK